MNAVLNLCPTSKRYSQLSPSMTPAHKISAVHGNEPAVIPDHQILHDDLLIPGFSAFLKRLIQDRTSDHQ